MATCKTRFTVKRNTETEEWEVRRYCNNRPSNITYYTNDKANARSTMLSMVAEFIDDNETSANSITVTTA